VAGKGGVCKGLSGGGATYVLPVVETSESSSPVRGDIERAADVIRQPLQGSEVPASQWVG
jgi:hypothetical protein